MLGGSEDMPPSPLLPLSLTPSWPLPLWLGSSCPLSPSCSPPLSFSPKVAPSLRSQAPKLAPSQALKLPPAPLLPLSLTPSWPLPLERFDISLSPLAARLSGRLRLPQLFFFVGLYLKPYFPSSSQEGLKAKPPTAMIVRAPSRRSLPTSFFSSAISCWSVQ